MDILVTVAQLVVRLPGRHDVVGSNPLYFRRKIPPSLPGVLLHLSNYKTNFTEENEVIR